MAAMAHNKPRHRTAHAWRDDPRFALKDPTLLRGVQPQSLVSHFDQLFGGIPGVGEEAQADLYHLSEKVSFNQSQADFLILFPLLPRHPSLRKYCFTRRFTRSISLCHTAGNPKSPMA